MRTRIGRQRVAVVVVYLLLLIVTVAVLGSRFVSPHELSSPARQMTSAADAEG